MAKFSKRPKIAKKRPATSVKVSNKNHKRQGKSGKIKPKNKKLPKFKRVDPSPVHKTNDKHDSDVNDSSDAEDDQTLKNNTFSMVTTNKRKHEENENFLLKDFERVPRNSFTNKKVKFLLPLKDHSGLIPQVVEIQDENEVPDNEETENSLQLEDLFGTTEDLKNNLTFVELCALRQKKLNDLKEKVGVLCISITENPEEKLRIMKEVLAMLDMNDPDIYVSVRKIVCMSLVEVFKDILPSYKIRGHSQNEQGQKLKKETRQLRDYESSLLKYYKQFLCKLEKMLECLKSKYKSKVPDQNLEAKFRAKHLVATIAMKCFSELLLAHPNFNYSQNILKIIVDRMLHKNTVVSDICCDTMTRVFKADKVGEVSYEAVKLIKKLAKSRNFNVPPCILQTFLSLNVKDARKSEPIQKKDPKQAKKEKEMMSRKQKKQQKKMQELEHELLEASAEESKTKKSKYQLQILNEVFLIYFSVLKGEFNLDLMSPVLEGLAKFAHLINIDFFDDLILVLYKILESDRIGYIGTLHCLKSVFIILSGQGDSLNIDPQGFYRHLYKCLLKVNIDTSDETVHLLLECIDLMVIQRRKKITKQRVLALLKRLSAISLSQMSHVTLAFLCVIRQLLAYFKQCDILLDAENSGSGQYNPELDDPEYCHASSTVLWELHQLVHSHHPVVAKFAKHIIHHCPTHGQGQLHSFLTLKSPSEILKVFGKDKNFGLAREKAWPPSAARVKKLHPCVTNVNSVTSQAVMMTNNS